MPKTSSGPVDQDFRAGAPMPRMDRGVPVPIYRLRPPPPAAASVTPWATRPDCRGRHAPPRGCRLAPPSRPPRAAAIGPSSPGRVQPALVGCPAGTLLRPARDPPAMAPGPGAASLDLLAPTSWATSAYGGHSLCRPSPGQREPDLGSISWALPPTQWGSGSPNKPTTWPCTSPSAPEVSSSSSGTGTRSSAPALTRCSALKASGS
jgi:hypothetical protein